jgi:hypothetical protein
LKTLLLNSTRELEQTVDTVEDPVGELGKSVPRYLGDLEQVEFVCRRLDSRFELTHGISASPTAEYSEPAYWVMRYNINIQYYYMYSGEELEKMHIRRQEWIEKCNNPYPQPRELDNEKMTTAEPVQIFRRLNSAQTIQSLIGAGVPISTVHHDLMPTLAEQLEYSAMSAATLGICDYCELVQDTMPTIAQSTAPISLFTMMAV